MKHSSRFRLGSLALGAVLVVSGCKSKPAAVAIRNPDGSVTNPDGSVTYPSGSQQAQQAEQPNAPLPPGEVRNADGSVTLSSGTAATAAAPPTETAATPPPPAPAPAPARTPAPVERPRITVPSGTRVDVSLSQSLSASHNNVGDQFSGSLARPVVTTGGSTIFKRGDNVSGTVVAAKGKGRFKGSGALGIELTSIAGHSVSTSEYEKADKGRGKRSTAIIGGGGGLGAIIGGLAGGGKGALIGGLAGAGAGTAGAAYTGSRDVIIPAESVITFQTTSPITVR